LTKHLLPRAPSIFNPVSEPIFDVTKTVPAADPSDFHTCDPIVKNRVPFTFKRFDGDELLVPGTMSATKPLVVPSVFQSSFP
jgi:hypothetical protein